MDDNNKSSYPSSIRAYSWKKMEEELDKYPEYPWREYVLSYKTFLRPNRFGIIRVMNVSETHPVVEVHYPIVLPILFCLGLTVVLGLVAYFVFSNH